MDFFKNHGFFLVDKPVGISSFDVIRILRKKLKIKKMGHSGTLDPFASGLMIILVGNAVKFQNRFMQLGKTYTANIVFGEETDTLDLTGKIISEKSVTDSLYDLKNKMEKAIEEKFIGAIEQVPPNYSAVKVFGKRAYDLSRKNYFFELNPRRISIEKLKILSLKKIRGRDKKNEDSRVMAVVQVVCSSGTYIRSLARDLAYQLNTVGHVDWLERTDIGSFSLKNALSMNQIEQLDGELSRKKSQVSFGTNVGNLWNYLYPIDCFIRGINLGLQDHEVIRLRHGHFKFLNNRLENGYNLLYFRNKLVAIVEKKENISSLPYNLVPLLNL